MIISIGFLNFNYFFLFLRKFCNKNALINIDFHYCRIANSIIKISPSSERFLFNRKFLRNFLLNKISLPKYQTGSNYSFFNPTTLFQPFLISYTKISQSACYKYHSRVFPVIIRGFNLPYFSFFINIYGI